MRGNSAFRLWLATLILQFNLACSNDTPTSSEPVTPDDISSIAMADEAEQTPGNPNEDLPGSLTDETSAPSTDTAIPSSSETVPDAAAQSSETYEDAFTETPTQDANLDAEATAQKAKKRSSEAGPRPKRVSKKVVRYVNATMLNVRSKPSPRSKIVRRLLGGTKLSVELHGKYAKIKNGQWCSSRYLSSTPTRKVSRTEAEQAWRPSAGAGAGTEPGSSNQ